MKTLHFILLLALLPVFCFAADTQRVAHVINGKSFVLESGDTVRLASIEAPNVQEADTFSRRGRPGEPLGEDAKQALEKLLAQKTVTLETNKTPRDRHNRILAQGYAGSVWLQGALLREGYAMVYSFSDTPHELTQKMLAEEQAARKEKRGIWAHPYYRVVTPAEAEEFLNRFRLVEGKVASVRTVRGNTYINFFDPWRGRFHLFISGKDAKAFAGFDVAALAGKTVRVRGWIDFKNAPSMRLTHPDQVELP